jgi:hypothetical protein
MDEFGFWQKWGLELDDTAFANAFLALGILSAVPSSKDPSMSGENLQERLRAVLAISKKSGRPVAWRFPKQRNSVQMGGERVILSSLSPLLVAKVWNTALQGSDIKPRFQILGYPETESITPWFRVLFEADAVQAAHIMFENAQAHLFMKWPLRLGFLPGNAAEDIVQQSRLLWPAKDLTEAIQIDRDNANCDVLVFSGSSSQLLKALLETPVPQKTNLFIVRGTLEDDPTAVSKRLAVIAAESRASGFVFVNSSITDEILGQTTNRFIENLSHNQPVDVAVSEAFAKKYSADPVIFLSRDIAIFQIEHVLEKTRSRLIRLPKVARPQIASDIFIRMGIPPEKIKYDVGVPGNAAKILKVNKKAVQFDRESCGASGTAEMNKAIDRAETQIVDEKRQKRSLQEQIYIKKNGEFVEERRAFLKGVPTLIRVRIGLPDKKWVTIKEGFPEEKLPKDRGKWRLTVVLTEPNHLKETLRKSIQLPASGTSEECEFRIQPGDHPIFDGRITMMHQGRVLQTAMLSGDVVSDESNIKPDMKISFEITRVRFHMGDLDDRRQFDLALVMNHTTAERPYLTAISADHAWLANIAACQSIVEDLNIALTNVAESVTDYQGGLGSDENVALLVKLARIGHQLYGKIVLGQIRQPGNQAKFENMEYIQIVSTDTEAMMPLEFIYTAVAPNDDAKLCPRMMAVLKETAKNVRVSKASKLIEETCQKVNKGNNVCQYRTTEYVCPMGFWGTSKVIERHMSTPLLAQPGKSFIIQSEKTTARGQLQLSGPAVVAASRNVKPEMLSPVLSACSIRLGAPPQEAKDWNDWIRLIKTYKPHILLALPHTAGNGANATLEINGKTLLTGQITEDHVHAADENTYPLVALLGCDTTGTALDYGEAVSWFRWQGAALVISTIAKVFGGHAAAVAGQLINGLKRDTGQQERVGEIIRAIKQQALVDGSLMALCIVAFGDADWKLN